MEGVTFFSFESIISTEPMTVLRVFMDELRKDSFQLTSIETPEQKEQLAEQLNKMASYSCYFVEMQETSKIYKRKLKNQKVDKDLIDNALAYEEIFETLKYFCEKQMEVLSKLMTLKRLELDEFKLTGYEV